MRAMVLDTPGSLREADVPEPVPGEDEVAVEVVAGYAERLVARREFVFSIPDSFGDLDAAPLLCAGIIGYRSLRLSGIQPGGRLGLFGFGSSAHLAIQVARHWGCEVCVFTRSE